MFTVQNSFLVLVRASEMPGMADKSCSPVCQVCEVPCVSLPCHSSLVQPVNLPTTSGLRDLIVQGPLLLLYHCAIAVEDKYQHTCTKT